MARKIKKDVPYLVTLMVAISAWSVTHIADRVLKTPVVEYEVTRTPSEVRIALHNLSASAFANLRFEIQGDDIRACSTPITFEPPAWAASSGPEEGTKGVGFPIAQLQPDWRIALCALYRGDQEPIFVLKQAGDQPIELRKSSVATWVLKYEAPLLVILFVLSFLVVAYRIFCEPD